jgi:aminoglycoside 6'-N-acetyltransferase I
MIRIERCLSAEQHGWLELRQELWPQGTAQEHLTQITGLSAEPQRYANFIAYHAKGHAIGLAEASLRSDYVNGTDTSPVVFLEGIYVDSKYRRQNIAGQLIATVADWGRTKGCLELASDTSVENELSQTVHKALGFKETERVVFFKLDL